MAIIYPFPPYSAYTWSTPVVPKLYWDVYSQEQRMKALCMEYAKLIAYNSDLADTLNNYVEVVNTLQQQLPELVNEDVVAEINRLVTTGEFAEMVHDAIEQLTTDVQEQLDALNKAIEDEGTNRLNADNALQAQIDKIVADRKGTYVTYEDFGAKLDGTTDDSAAIIACHEYANENGVPVVQHRGKVTCNYTVDVKTSCDFSGMEFTVTDETPSSVYNIVPDATQDIVWNGTVRTVDVQSYTDDLDGCSCVVYNNNQTWSLGNREGTETEMFHNQPMAFDEQGFRISYPVYVENTGQFTFANVQSLYQNVVVFEGANVTLDYKNDMVNMQNFILSTRNNVVIRNITLEVKTLPSLNANPNTAGGFIQLFQCANNSIYHVYANNNSVVEADGSIGQWSYIFYVQHCFNTHIKDCVSIGGWGVVGSNFTDTLIVEDCVTNRIDNHYGMFGTFKATGCTINGIAQCSCGYGDGVWSVENCTFTPTSLRPQLVDFRTDFPITWGGTTVFANITIDDPNATNSQVVFRPLKSKALGNFPTSNQPIIIENMRYMGNRYLCATKTFADQYDYVLRNVSGSISAWGGVNLYCNGCRFIATSTNASDGYLYFYNCDLNFAEFSIPNIAFFFGCRLYVPSITCNESYLQFIGCAILPSTQSFAGSANYAFSGCTFGSTPTALPTNYRAAGNINLEDR